MKRIFIVVFVFLCFSFSGYADILMKLSSPDFNDYGKIPRALTCQGENQNPVLEITGVPQDAKSLALIMDDPDAPMGDWVHWVVFNIDPKTTTIGRASLIGVSGVNDFGNKNYGGPCPPRGAHRYFLKLYALDILLDLKEGITKNILEQAMEGHILEQTQLVGIYQKM
ncbi:MAG TPA: YbhB/YbcL family Raf kinase inhibitor-like protein [Candidatus Omnitrophota bacterium]|nr:YbhB/YbcL family Raf kinase inhibitor-like protein [Candidatus Omnitrophota bacterium]HPN89068.1 YbhB/YbcL family Raf kinase inhibitor-like protein [Candidatus Omnitrophota bacterium]